MATCGVCPECGLPGIPIMYGLYGDDVMPLVRRGVRVLGGCETWPDQPDHLCPRRHRWNSRRTPPKKPRSARRSGPRPRFASETEEEASTAFAAGRYDDAERAYRALLDAATERHGEDHRETLVMRQALTLVLDAAGRTDDAAATFAPIRRAHDPR